MGTTRCGHSACSQNFIDAADTSCVAPGPTVSARRPDELWDGREWVKRWRFHDDDKVSAFVVEYGAIPASVIGGFLPAKWTGDDPIESVLWWSKGGMALEEAIEIAHEAARKYAERYSGDWKITVRHRTGDEHRARPVLVEVKP